MGGQLFDITTTGERNLQIFAKLEDYLIAKTEVNEQKILKPAMGSMTYSLKLRFRYAVEDFVVLKGEGSSPAKKAAKRAKGDKAAKQASTAHPTEAASKKQPSGNMLEEGADLEKEGQP